MMRNTLNTLLYAFFTNRMNGVWSEAKWNYVIPNLSLGGSVK